MTFCVRDEVDNPPVPQGMKALPAEAVEMDSNEELYEFYVENDFTLDELFEEYLEHSLRFYEMGAPVITDADYDVLCGILYDNWKDITHRLKRTTTRSDLKKCRGWHVNHIKELDYLRRLIEKYPDSPLNDNSN